ncbi:MAG: RING finger protein [Candidatus Pacebacteria bacterium]|nr:RING finger protein [Candidatus Paceibacterota bacterium]
MATVVPVMRHQSRPSSLRHIKLSHSPSRLTIVTGPDQPEEPGSRKHEASERSGADSTRALSSRTVPVNSGKLRRASDSVQVLSLVTGEVREHGEHWKMARLSQHVLARLFAFYTLLYSGPQLKAQLCLSLVSAFADVITSLVFFVWLQDELSSPAFYILLMNIVFAFPVLGNLSCQLHTALHGNMVTEHMLFVFMISAIFYYSFGLLSVVVIWDEQLAGVIILSAAIYLTCPAFNAVLTAIVALAPLAVLGLTLELLMRIIVCKTRCPRREKVRRNLRYQTYLFERERFEVTDCTICLGRFEESDFVCLLLCHSSHVFHERCILAWLEKQVTCPICRQDIQFQDS